VEKHSAAGLLLLRRLMTPLLEALISNMHIKPWVWVIVGAFVLGLYADRTARALDDKASRSSVESIGSELHAIHIDIDSIKQRVRDLACAQRPLAERPYCR
jgi:hypothetical protein